MRWTPGYRSENVEDDRAEGGRGSGRAPGGLRLGLGGFLLLLVLSFVFKRNFFTLLHTGGGAASGSLASRRAPGQGSTTDPSEQRSFDLVNVTLDDVQERWKGIFPHLGKQYSDARLVVFRDSFGSACGRADAASGPFYCPGDRKVYIDLGFYDELKARFGAPGDFAQAYVVAHEMGHHVQNLLGIEERVRTAQERRPDLVNDLSVRLELQADCLAGVWGHAPGSHVVLEKGDVEGGLDAAAAIGDDRLQRMTRGSANPESFTHGSSRQRVEWFRKGLEAGTPNACDTFAARRL